MSYPVRHVVGVSLPVVVVEDHDGADHAAGHHDHDAREVGPYQRGLAARRLHVRHLGGKRCLVRTPELSCCHHVHEHCEGHEHRDLQGHLLPGVGGEVEAEYGHAAGSSKKTWFLCSVQMCAPRYQHTGTDEV